VSPANEQSSTVHLAQQRACLAHFMDDNPDTFAAPEGGGDWSAFVAQGAVPEGRDRHVVDKALGMLVGMIRTAQNSLGANAGIAEVFAQAGLSGDFEADPAVLAQGGPEQDPEEHAAFAQAVTIYKQCAEHGLIEGEALPRFIEEAFDNLPGTSPLTRSLIEAAKRMVRLDLEFVLAQPGAGAAP